MLEFAEIHYTIAIHYLPAIINDDWTGLDENEILELTTFLDRETKGNESFHAWTVPNQEPELATCEISGLYGECEKVILLVKVNG